MAGPIFTAAVNKVGQTIFRKAGRFISKQEFLRGKSRGRSGAFRDKQTVVASLSDKGIAEHLLATIGQPVGGGDWVSRVRRSSERFTELLGDNNQLG